MATLTIRSRTTKDGEKRYDVRYRLGGRTYGVQHGGTFETLKDAKIRRALIGGELAAGRNPKLVLDQLRDPAPMRTFSSWADAYIASRFDVSAATKEHTNGVLKRLRDAFGGTAPADITPSMVQEWIASLNLKPSSVRSYVGTLRRVLDYAGIDPNPARDRHVRLPRDTRDVIEPPSADNVEAIIANVPPRWRLAIQVLAETGMRATELCNLEWRDVDEAQSRIRVRNGKTAAARRWVAVPEELMRLIAASTPPDDRTAERRVFTGATRHVFKNIMSRACKSAGIAHYHPHDLRHRYASVQIARGVPVTQVAAHLGHARKSMTLDTYSHVLLGEEAIR